MFLIMTIYDVFQLEERGTLISGEPGPAVDLAQPGAAIELHTPEGEVVHDSVGDFERPYPCFGEGRPRPILILLKKRIASEQLPGGTKVYCADPASTPKRS
jgi:hypothetical protein